MSEQDDSWMDKISGLGLGVAVLLGGLVLTIANLGPGATLGIPLILIGILIPVAKTYTDGVENDRQEKRRRPERDHNASYEIETKGYKNRRNR